MSANILVIPKETDEVSADIKANKEKYMKHILRCFTELVNTSPLPSKVSLFKFRQTNLEVIVKQASYITNLQNLLDYYIKLEEYENCTIIKEIIIKIENMNNKDGKVEQD
jgi:hypothetical protein